MDVFYINLAKATDRRDALERNFAATNSHNWRLQRIEAVTADVAVTRTGNARPAEKACFLSHAKGLVAAKSVAGHVMFVEDDVLFGQTSMQTIESALTVLPEQNWDIIFSDICVAQGVVMTELFHMRADLVAKGNFELLKLARMPFAGSTAYIVNRNYKDRLAQALATQPRVDLPYDLYLQRLVTQENVRGYAIFPFATTLSHFADKSQVQGAGDTLNEFVWNEFRRLMWAERDIGAVRNALTKLGEDEPDAAAFAKLLVAMQRPAYDRKK